MEDGRSKISIGIFELSEETKRRMLDAALKEKRKTLWIQQIRDSEIFLVLGTPVFFNQAMAVVQAEYAKSLNKPFRVLLQKGTEIPEGFFDGVEDIRISEFVADDKQSLIDAFKELMGKEALKRFQREGINMVGEGF